MVDEDTLRPSPLPPPHLPPILLQSISGGACGILCIMAKALATRPIATLYVISLLWVHAVRHVVHVVMK